MGDRELDYKIQYIVLCVSEFASRYHLTNRQAYAYLNRYEGLSFLDDCYEAEHTLSLDDAVADLTVVCKRNGGGLGA
ncbi:MAG: DUF3791 domain-containing protein [Prevotella sp.]|nr:DUF3791 domain-containing protein [Prevotella sp.]